MSSIIFTNNVRTVPVEDITLRGVSRKQPEGLAEYLARKLRDNPDLTLRKIEERAGREGLRITHSYLSKIISGAATNPSIDKLRAIAAGLGVAFEEVSAAVGGSPLSHAEAFDGEVAVLFKGIHDLSPDDQAEMRAMVRVLAAEVERRRPRRVPNNGKGKR